MIKVLITEDSPVVRGYLKHILSSDPDIQVVGTAKDGEEAVRMAPMNKPDVITMDIHMPKMDGFEATRKIMETSPTPIVIVSASWNPEEVDKTFRTMEAGAVAALEKPRGMGHPDSESSVKELIQTVKLMSDVKVVRRWSKTKRIQKAKKVEEEEVSEPIPKHEEIHIVAIGASTGGPVVLQKILFGLKKQFKVPVVIVQHIAPGFLPGLCEWLNRTTSFSVTIAKNGEKIKPGIAYLAPDGFQMSIDSKHHIQLNDEAPEYHLCPSVSYLFRSVASTYGKKAVGVLLTGMGKDGASELKMMRDKGAITIAQDKESSVIHGMPGEAIKLDAASYILSSDKISVKLNNLM